MCLKSIEILQLWRITAAGCLNQRVNLIPRLAPFFNPLHGVDSPKNGKMITTMAIWCYMYWMYCLSHDLNLTETDKKNLNCHSNPWKFGRSSQQTHGWDLFAEKPAPQWRNWVTLWHRHDYRLGECHDPSGLIGPILWPKRKFRSKKSPVASFLSVSFMLFHVPSCWSY